jgi:hypothetical protein
VKNIEVTWRDSQIYVSQVGISEIFEVCTLTSVGYLVSKNTKQVVLARDVVNDDVRGVLVIPRENITKLRRLR